MKFLIFILLLSVFAGCKPSSSPTRTEQPPIAATQEPAAAPATPVPNTAYGSAEFGMSFEQVIRLPQFKGWLSDANIPYVCKFDEKIDSEKYRVTLFFHQDTLYRADFTSAHDLYSPASSLETDLRREVINFKDFITQTYGAPDTAYGIPDTSNIFPGRVSFAYKWEIGTVRITIGISQERTDKKYKMVAQVYDEPTYQAVEAEKNALSAPK